MTNRWAEGSTFIKSHDAVAGSDVSWSYMLDEGFIQNQTDTKAFYRETTSPSPDRRDRACGANDYAHFLGQTTILLG